jgi:hypothetical protein
MAIEVTIDFDSGCFLPTKPIYGGGYSCEIGYFQNPEIIPDVRVFVDNSEKVYNPPLKLGCDNGVIEIIHRNADGTPRKDGVKPCMTFHSQLLHLKDLYDEDVDMDPTKFDCIFRFESGGLVPSMIKSRGFKEAIREQSGAFRPTGNRKERPPVSHNVSFHFTLGEGEVLEVAKDGKPWLSSETLNPQNLLKIEFPVDNGVANKYFYYAFQKTPPGDMYWLPNDGDPPPNCPCPPCPEGLGFSDGGKT